jgi:NADPH2:quinone reductase
MSESSWAQNVISMAGRPADVFLDTVGGSVVAEGIRCLRPGGKYLVMGFASGDIPSIAINRLLLRNIEMIGVAWGDDVERDPKAFRRRGTEILQLLPSDDLGGTGFVSYPLENAQAARLGG